MSNTPRTDAMRENSSPYLERQRDAAEFLCEELELENAKLKEALQVCVLVAKSWHGPMAWEIYYNNAPEMKLIRDLLGTI